MSIDAVRWALSIQLKPASTKFVLVAMAERVGDSHECFPSVERLKLDTSLDRKTVFRAIQDLQKQGLIRDTGERRGATKQVRVYQLLGVVGREESGPNPDTFEGDQKRNSSETGTVPFFPGKGTKNGTLKGTKNGTQNRKGNHKGTSARKKKCFVPPTQQEVIDYFTEKGFPRELAVRAFEYYEANDWHDAKDNKVRSWKQKMRGVWMKPENKANETGNQTSDFLQGAI